jgi:hypothetical protein
MNDEDAQMFESAAGFISNNYPKALRDFYNKCNSEGFNPEQCMTLTGKYFEMLLLNAANSEPEDSDSDSGEFELGD